MIPVENILLDAEIVGVLSTRAFRAKLANGHKVVAFQAGRDESRFGRVSPGDRVAIVLSTFDMSKGRIIRRIQEEAVS